MLAFWTLFMFIAETLPALMDVRCAIDLGEGRNVCSVGTAVARRNQVLIPRLQRASILFHALSLVPHQRHV
jgi:hypothetical protein